ncbi:MAG TPA: 6-phospho-3-hexuloisomerase [Candidatus Thermoplasmatota archaeon]|nr:6-phospho-3-hexuloisomerase [Candidatus Thermoplasmatota archaeon]
MAKGARKAAARRAASRPAAPLPGAAKKPDLRVSPLGLKGLREPLDYIEAASRKMLSVPERTLKQFLDTLQPARRVFLYGRGRSGFVARAFAVRLMHLGYQTYVVGETITAPVARNDVVILVSGTGTTYPVVMTAELGRRQGATVVSITAQPDSEIARLAHVVIPLMPPDSNGERAKLAPLGTLFETSAWLFFDAVVALLMQRLGETEASMRKRHATLE